MTYCDYLIEIINTYPNNQPIYTKELTNKLQQKFHLIESKALAATAVAIKRILDNNSIPNLRKFQNGIYYKTIATPFGETPIDKNQIIYDKYLINDKGYDAAYYMLYQLGLTTQLPKKRTIVTNNLKTGFIKNEELDIILFAPKIKITKQNKPYLQLLDTLELLDKAPVDNVDPELILCQYIQKHRLDYVQLLAMTHKYYPKKVLNKLALLARKEMDL